MPRHASDILKDLRRIRIAKSSLDIRTDMLVIKCKWDVKPNLGDCRSTYQTLQSRA